MFVAALLRLMAGCKFIYISSPRIRVKSLMCQHQLVVLSRTLPTCFYCEGPLVLIHPHTPFYRQARWLFDVRLGVSTLLKKIDKESLNPVLPDFREYGPCLRDGVSFTG